jgi:hypothetical protein
MACRSASPPTHTETGLEHDGYLCPHFDLAYVAAPDTVSFRLELSLERYALAVPPGWPPAPGPAWHCVRLIGHEANVGIAREAGDAASDSLRQRVRRLAGAR